MTIFGKLLVFMNLVFAVVTGALIVFVFTTRANWQTAFEDAKKKAEAAEVAYNNEKAAHENDLKQKDQDAKSLQVEVTRLQAEVVRVQDDNQKLQKAASDQLNVTNKSATTEKALSEEVKQIKEERNILVKENLDFRTRIVNLQKDVDKEHNIAVNESLQAKNLLQKNTNLLRQVEELMVKVRDLESTTALMGTAGGTGSVGRGDSIIDQPPRSAPGGVRGKVTAIGTSGTSLAQIDVGSDSGLSPGNVLTVYKGNEYKGDLILTSVLPKTAVGKFTPAKRTSKIEKDDNVITSFQTSPQ